MLFVMQAAKAVFSYGMEESNSQPDSSLLLPCPFRGCNTYPRELENHEVSEMVQAYADAASRAKKLDLTV